MPLWLVSLWSRISASVIAAGAVLAAVGAIFLAGRRQGKTEAQLDHARSVSEAQQQADRGASQYRGDGGARGALGKGEF